MSKDHFILDYETLCSDALVCAALECSYVVFDWDRFIENPYTYNELLDMAIKAKFDVRDQVKRLGYKVDSATIDWWNKQDKQVLKRMLPSSTDITVETFITDLIAYLKTFKVKYWWSRSNSFDPVILTRMGISTSPTARNEIAKYLQHWKCRDTRTFIDAKFDFSAKENGFIPIKDEKLWEQLFQKHDSQHDIVADILRLQAITRVENNLELIQ